MNRKRREEKKGWKWKVLIWKGLFWRLRSEWGKAQRHDLGMTSWCCVHKRGKQKEWLRHDFVKPLYCSIATAACIWYIDFLPPTLFAVSCLCNLKYLGSIRLPLWGCNSCDTSGRVQECGHIEIKVSQVNSYVLPVLCLNRTRKKCAVIVKDFSVHNFGKWN